MSELFKPMAIRGTTFKHRIFVSPMCQYSSDDGMPSDWHFVHLGSRSVGGAALVVVEATAVCPEGRISPADSGLWSEAHARAFQRVTAFLEANGAVPGIQLAHAGRKASTQVPWKGSGAVSPADGGWEPLAPSALPFAPSYPQPRAMTAADIEALVRRFEEAARFALLAGFRVIELHFAHGYLLHEFLSPLSNRRTDDYGGTLENRMRLPLRVAQVVRAAWPDDRPLFVRISATDWAEGGWDLPQSLELARRLRALGVDLIDCSSGGLVADAKVPVAPGYQVPFAAAVRREAGIATGAVGLITEAQQAEAIVARGEADAVFLARALLRDPYWPLHAAKALSADTPWPSQYARARD